MAKNLHLSSEHLVLDENFNLNFFLWKGGNFRDRHNVIIFLYGYFIVSVCKFKICECDFCAS